MRIVIALGNALLRREEPSIKIANEKNTSNTVPHTIFAVFS